MITVGVSCLAVPFGAGLAWMLVPLLPRRVPAAEHLVAHRRLAALLTGAAFGVVGWRFGPAPELAAYLAFATGCVPLAIIDARSGRLPNVLTLPLFGAGLALLGVAALFTAHGWAAFVAALVGAVALAGMYLVLAVANPSGMGFGDVKLALPLGLHLGWLGAATWVVGALLGAVFGALGAVVLLAAGRASWRTRLPYGPFMVTGAVVAIAVVPLVPELGMVVSQ